ncbi:MAG TPA: CBS domain-containing protein [Thermoanaerobaculia bacterium]|nr:CBS domain-containing protein [Thermoanaerobaculia bacterium]
MQVRDLMTTHVWSCSENGTVASAANTMLDHSCGFVPIVGSNGEVRGVVTDRDLCMAIVRLDRRPAEIPLAEVCSGRVVGCRPDQEVHDVLEIMESARVHRLPVLENGRLKGIISMTDVLRHASPVRSPDGDCLTCAEAVGALKMITAARRPRRHRVAAAE